MHVNMVRPQVKPQVNTLLGLLGLLGLTMAGPTSGHKNVLMFAVDDLRGEFGESYNASWIKVSLSRRFQAGASTGSSLVLVL